MLGGLAAAFCSGREHVRDGRGGLDGGPWDWRSERVASAWRHGSGGNGDGDIAWGQGGEDGGGWSVVMKTSRGRRQRDRESKGKASPAGLGHAALECVSAEAQAAATKCCSVRGLGCRHPVAVGGTQSSAVFVRRRSTLAARKRKQAPVPQRDARHLPPANAIGRRCTLLIFTTVFSVGAILQTVAGGSRGLGYVYAGRVVAGVGIGAISAVAPAYVSECAPKDVRGRITGLFQIMVAIGVMLSYFINRASPRCAVPAPRADR
ncbi:hypothetical protein CERSUDRAFT_127759 [Gelatoporia subvermispora B]|uniref:Major facilitator superfamily (MFS) profile domain-containing protein n=1 Tax=Ceriporiopsis subvermispora (strain B) TaxID=914234 RepID=M2QFA2_CERS8|nr:hypothetical protein CERSUDRAFT_127759 [Gelatoporia subvermispora B]